MEVAVPAREALMDDEQRKQFAQERNDLLEALEDLMDNYEKSHAAYADILRLFEQVQYPFRNKDGAKVGLELDGRDAAGTSYLEVNEAGEREPPDNPEVQEAAPVDAEGLLGALQTEKKSPTMDAKDRTVVLLRNLSRTTNGSILLQGGARLEKVTFEEVEMESLDAFYLAVKNLMDFMNGRAALVDDWRQIQIAADALQSALKLTIHGNARTERNHPVSIDPRTSTLNLETIRGRVLFTDSKLKADLAGLAMDEGRRDRALVERDMCIIRAPKSGMVSYPSAAAWEETPDVTEGANARRDQTLLLMPDLGNMQVKVGIHESVGGP